MQRDRIARQLLQVAAHDGEEFEPEHRRPPQRCCGIPAPTNRLTFLAGSSRSVRPVKWMKTSSSESFCTVIEVTRSPALFDGLEDFRNRVRAVVGRKLQAVSAVEIHLAQIRHRLQHLGDSGRIFFDHEIDPVRARHHRFESDRRVERDYLAAVDDCDPIAQRLGLVHVMRRERDGDLAFLAQRFEQVPHGAAALRVESDSRLVEEQHVGRMNQAARDFEPPAHPARVSRDEIVGALGQPDHVQQAMSAFAALAARQAEELAVNVDVLPSGEIEIGGERLRDDADILAHLARMTRDVEAGDERLAAARRYQRRQHPHHASSCRRRWGRAARRPRHGGPRS